MISTRHQICPSPSLRCIMTSPVCPLNIFDRRVPHCRHFRWALHLKRHNFCCITIPRSPNSACGSRGSFFLSLATQRRRETPHYGNTRCVSTKGKLADIKIHPEPTKMSCVTSLCTLFENALNRQVSLSIQREDNRN